MTPDPKRIIDMANAFYDSCVLFCACELAVFSKLAELGNADAHTVAEALDLDPRGTRLLLDGCVAVGLLEKEGDVYRNSAESGAFLVPDQPGNLAPAVGYSRDVYPAWGRLARLVRTGKPVEKPALHLGSDPQRTKTFVMAMHRRAMAIGTAVVPMLDLRGCRTVLDVGGGSGAFSMLLARKYPDASFMVMDLPAIVDIASRLIRDQGLDARVKTWAADYHHSEFPGGNDGINIFGVLHQESPESIQDLLCRSYSALVPGGLINIMDMMTDTTHTAPKFSALFAVNMALTTENGWVFSDEELGQWLLKAGFREILVRPLPPPMPHWLATARKT